MPKTCCKHDHCGELDRSPESRERRRFLWQCLASGSGLLASSWVGKLWAQEHQWKVVPGTHQSQVGRVEHAGVIASPLKIDGRLTKRLFETALCLAMEMPRPGDAWAKVFPDYKTGQVIAIKLTCVNRLCASHPELVYALAQSLIDWGVPANDIILFDRSDGELQQLGYVLNHSAKGIRCFGTFSPTYQTGYDDTLAIPLRDGIFFGIPYFTRILTKMCDYVINVPVLKNHSDAGVTLSLKNHYGSFNNPEAFHDNGCDPFAARLNAHPVIQKKSKLVVLDALACVVHGGPMGVPQALPGTVLVGTDPIAVDTVGLLMLDELRFQQGFKSVMNQAHHISTGAEIGLGINDPNFIVVKKRKLG